jgi:hypothetical protein
MSRSCCDTKTLVSRMKAFCHSFPRNSFRRGWLQEEACVISFISRTKSEAETAEIGREFT